MGWRATQVEATRERIIEVFRELGSGSDAAAPTLAEVSRISGVSLATIHRHFRSRDDLVAAASVDRSFLGVERPDAWTFDDSRAHLVALWSDLAENMAMTREGAFSQAGRELRQARYEALEGQARAAFADLGFDVEDPVVERFLHAFMLLSSVHAFLDLSDRQGLSPIAAVEVVDWAGRVLAREVGIDVERAVFRYSAVPSPTPTTPSTTEAGEGADDGK